MEAELNRLDIPPVFTRLLHEALFAASAFTFYDGVSMQRSAWTATSNASLLACLGPRAADGDVGSFS
eukprot:8143652-Pyramimonas_sp.AAC.1